MDGPAEPVGHATERNSSIGPNRSDVLLTFIRTGAVRSLVKQSTDINRPASGDVRRVEPTLLSTRGLVVGVLLALVVPAAIWVVSYPWLAALLAVGFVAGVSALRVYHAVSQRHVRSVGPPRANHARR